MRVRPILLGSNNILRLRRWRWNDSVNEKEQLSFEFDR